MLTYFDTISEIGRVVKSLTLLVIFAAVLAAFSLISTSSIDSPFSNLSLNFGRFLVITGEKKSYASFLVSLSGSISFSLITTSSNNRFRTSLKVSSTDLMFDITFPTGAVPPDFWKTSIVFLYSETSLPVKTLPLFSSANVK